MSIKNVFIPKWLSTKSINKLLKKLCTFLWYDSKSAFYLNIFAIILGEPERILTWEFLQVKDPYKYYAYVH